MKPALIIIFLLLAKAAAWCQETFKRYEWENDRKRYPVAQTEESLPEVILKLHVQHDYRLEDNQFIMYSTNHRIILVNNDEAIQKNNRIYIPMSNAIELTDLKARTISREGKVVNFDQGNMKEIKDEETGNAFRIFAMEGVELGSEIEYFFIRKMGGHVFDSEFFQFKVPLKNGSFKLTCPKHLKFDFKAYRGVPEVTEKADSLLNTYEVATNNVPALREEPFAYFDPNRARLEFKLAYNHARSTARLYTWEDAAKRFYEILTANTGSGEKAVTKFVKTLGVDSKRSMAERVRQTEGKIKTTIKVNQESGGEPLSSLDQILRYKVASKEGMTRLFLAVFAEMGIPCHPVLTSNREKNKFDGSFDSWSYLADYFLYFPETKGFLAPYFFETRYPMIPPEYTAQQGLFMEPFSMGDLKSALAAIKEIPAPDYSACQDDLEIEVSFDGTLESNRVLQKRDFGGYNAFGFTAYYDLMTEEKRGEMVTEIIQGTAPDAKIKTWSAKPARAGEVDKFTIVADFQSNHFLEKAGPKVLFKVGELIGPQVEMYQDEARVSEVENVYNRGYKRVIKINLPQGYEVKNAEDLRIKFDYSEGTSVPFLFHSDYELNGSVLVVKIDEWYKEISCPLARFEEFRKVINAAADFNKVTLVLEKKN